MFDSAFRTIFLSTPAKLTHSQKRLIISLNNNTKNTPLDSANLDSTLDSKNLDSKNLDSINTAESAQNAIPPPLDSINSINSVDSIKSPNNTKSKTFAKDSTLAKSALESKPPALESKTTKSALESTSAQNEQTAKNKQTAKTPAHNPLNADTSPYKSDKKDEIAIPLSDILCVILESPQITLSSSLLAAFAKAKILVFVCDEAHLPCGIFSPFLIHYKSLKILQTQIALKAQRKAILWQQMIKSKITNQALLLSAKGHIAQSEHLINLAKSTQLNDASNNEAKAAGVYFKALFGEDFSRKNEIDEKIGTINAGLNYGYAIVRGMVVRALCASGLNPALGLFHANAFNPFNLADDVIEPYRIFVDSLVLSMLENGEFLDFTQGLRKENRALLAQILSSKIRLENQFYPLYRAVIASVAKLVLALDSNAALALPSFEKEDSNGRKVYESASAI